MSAEQLNAILKETHDHMEKAISHLEAELTKVRAGKATPSMLDSVHADYYGTNTPLYQIASINTTDARTLVIQPFEKSMITAIEKGITVANLGFNPQNDGTLIRINVPALTEERRKDLVKQARHEGENARIGIRAARRDANEMIKKLIKDGLSEDLAKDAEGKTQHMTDEYITKVDKHLSSKEEEIMTV